MGCDRLQEGHQWSFLWVECGSYQVDLDSIRTTGARRRLRAHVCYQDISGDSNILRLREEVGSADVETPRVYLGRSSHRRRGSRLNEGVQWCGTVFTALIPFPWLDTAKPARRLSSEDARRIER